MSKLVIPYPPPQWPKEKIPEKACWWRHAMIDYGPDDVLYYVKRIGATEEKNWEDATAIEWEWYDGLETILDAGLDRPTVWNMCLVYVRPVDYIDVLADSRPSESFYRITEYGDHYHPGMVVCRDLDRS